MSADIGRVVAMVEGAFGGSSHAALASAAVPEEAAAVVQPVTVTAPAVPVVGTTTLVQVVREVPATTSSVVPRLNALIDLVGNVVKLLPSLQGQSQSPFPQQIGGNGTGLSAGFAVNQLANTAISAPSIAGGSVSGANVAATSLSSAGAANLAAANVGGDLSVGGDSTLAGNLTVGGILNAGTLTFTAASTTNLFTQAATSTTFYSTLATLASAAIATLNASVANVVGFTAVNGTTTSLVATNATTTNLVAANASLASLSGAAFSSLSNSYLPKWSNGTWTNSLVYDNGIGVGIGTTSPFTNFAVNGNAFFSGPVTAPIQDNGGQVFNVVAFGAVSNGITDDTVAFQKAIDAAKATGGEVFVPRGVYVVGGSVSLYIASNVSIVGTGASSTIVQKAGSTAPLFQTYDARSSLSASQVSVRNLYLEGQSGLQSNTQAIGVDIYGQGNNFLIDNVTFHNFYGAGVQVHPINTSNASYFPQKISIINSRFDGTGQSAVYLIDFNHVTISGDVFTNWGLNGLSTVPAIGGWCDLSCYGLTFTNNRLINTAGNSEFALEIVPSGTNGVNRLVGAVVANNYLDAGGYAGGTGVSLATNDSDFASNVFVNGGGDYRSGFELSGTDLTITGNNIQNGTIAITPYGGANSDTVSVSDNVVTNAGNNGTTLAVASSSNVTISNNQFDIRNATNSWNGVLLGQYGNAGTLTNMTFNGNTITCNSTSRDGIRFVPASGTVGVNISNNTVTGCSSGFHGLSNANATEVTISNNDFHGNSTGIIDGHTAPAIYRIYGNVTTTGQTDNLVIQGNTQDATASALNVENSAKFSLLYVRNDGNVGIGTTTPYSRLTVWGPDTAASTLAFSIVNSASTSLFTVNDLGNVGINNILPSYKLDVGGFINTDQYSGYKQAGNTVLYASTTNQSLAIGASIAAASFTGSSTLMNNIAIGYSAMASPLIPGATSNVAIGVQALGTNASGGNNIAIGTQALINNYSGGGNIALGSGSLKSNSSGSYNVALGQSSLKTNVSGASNTAVGWNTLNSGTASNNSVFGFQAGYDITVGANNTIIGTEQTTGGGISSGSNNIIIGQGVNAGLSPTSNNQLNIGNLIFGTGLGFNSNWATGGIGIGTSTPSARLTVWGPDSASSTPLLTAVNNSSTTVFAVFDGGNAQLSGTLSQSSDQRLKTNIQSLNASSSLSLIEELNPVTFNWVDPEKGASPQLGFIAQQVEPLFPGLVSTTSPTALTPDGTLSLNYIDLVAPIVSAIQAIQGEIASIERTVAGFAVSITTGEVNAHELCLDGTCITQSQLAILLAAEKQQSSISQSIGTTANATSTPPVVQINGANPAIIQVGAIYSDLGATITGPQGDVNLGIATYLNGVLMSPLTVDTSSVATDTIDYVVTDQSGLTSTSTRTVIIQSPASTSAAAASSATSTPQ